MTKRIDPIERLAMRICWLEFTPPRSRKALGTTEAEYWRALPDRVRQGRILDTRRMLWELRELHETDSSIDILEAVRDRYEEAWHD